MSIEYLVLKLIIEEDNKVSKRKSNPSSFDAKANMVEEVEKSHKKNHKKKLVVKRKGIAKKFKGKYYSFNKVGHRAKGCKNVPQLGNPRKSLHVAEVYDLSNDVSK
ncbi:hypothetical protein ACH5RR_029223 [Cinchona calisaya]|uniref:Uncharacterized protein n=1 Tax=Cinchona calisaya TaxID=153742 RepID=A0ABD2YVH7_9GENT